jgi:hypothetical protein
MGHGTHIYFRRQVQILTWDVNLYPTPVSVFISMYILYMYLYYIDVYTYIHVHVRAYICRSLPIILDLVWMYDIL